MKKIILAVVLAGQCCAAQAGAINLRDGTKIDGEIIGEMDGAELVKTKYGTLTIRKSDRFEPGVPEIIHSTDPAAARAASDPRLTFKTVKTAGSAAQTFYYEDSVLVATETFSASGVSLGLEGTVRDGVYMEHYDTGVPKTVKTMAGGKINGSRRDFFPNGTVQTEAQYAGGILNGPVVIRGETGGLLFEQNFKNGVPDGWFRQYDALGNVKAETFYSEGRTGDAPVPAGEGLAPKKAPAGEAGGESALTVKWQGLARGERFTFYLNGKYAGRVSLDKKFNITGKEGHVPDGAAKAYSKDGKLEKEFVFENDRVKLLRIYEPGGPLKAEYTYKEDTAVKK